MNSVFQLEFWHDLKCKQEEKERIPSIRPFTEFHAQIAVNRANIQIQYRGPATARMSTIFFNLPNMMDDEIGEEEIQ